ncbi:MAG: hypothetical protein MJ211_05130 [Bacteroidales bacterium]|nr:hypothetical protein [Bacteroidales bacterium]
MKKITIEQMQFVDGGVSSDAIWTTSGIACAAMLACAAVPVIGWGVSAAIFGPTCVGVAIGGLVS